MTIEEVEQKIAEIEAAGSTVSAKDGELIAQGVLEEYNKLLATDPKTEEEKVKKSKALADLENMPVVIILEEDYSEYKGLLANLYELQHKGNLTQEETNLLNTIQSKIDAIIKRAELVEANDGIMVPSAYLTRYNDLLQKYENTSDDSVKSQMIDLSLMYVSLVILLRDVPKLQELLFERASLKKKMQSDIPTKMGEYKVKAVIKKIQAPKPMPIEQIDIDLLSPEDKENLLRRLEQRADTFQTTYWEVKDGVVYLKTDADEFTKLTDPKLISSVKKSYRRAYNDTFRVVQNETGNNVLILKTDADLYQKIITSLKKPAEELDNVIDMSNITLPAPLILATRIEDMTFAEIESILATIEQRAEKVLETYCIQVDNEHVVLKNDYARYAVALKSSDNVTISNIEKEEEPWFYNTFYIEKNTVICLKSDQELYKKLMAKKEEYKKAPITLNPIKKEDVDISIGLPILKENMTLKEIQAALDIIFEREYRAEINNWRVGSKGRLVFQNSKHPEYYDEYEKAVANNDTKRQEEILKLSLDIRTSIFMILPDEFNVKKSTILADDFSIFKELYKKYERIISQDSQKKLEAIKVEDVLLPDNLPALNANMTLEEIEAKLDELSNRATIVRRNNWLNGVFKNSKHSEYYQEYLKASANGESARETEILNLSSAIENIIFTPVSSFLANSSSEHIILAKDVNIYNQLAEKYRRLNEQRNDPPASTNEEEPLAFDVENMTLEQIEAAMKTIRQRAAKVNRKNWIKASNGKVVLKSRLQEYEGAVLNDDKVLMKEIEIESANQLYDTFTYVSDYIVLNADVQLYRKLLTKYNQLKNINQAREHENRKKGKRKVTKRKKHNWKDETKLAFTIIFGLMYGENLTGKSEAFINIYAEVCKTKAECKTLSVEERNSRLKSLDKRISSSSDLSFDEKKKLYKKLQKLARKTERLNNKASKKTTKRSEATEDVLDEENDLLR